MLATFSMSADNSLKVHVKNLIICTIFSLSNSSELRQKLIGNVNIELCRLANCISAGKTSRTLRVVSSGTNRCYVMIHFSPPCPMVVENNYFLLTLPLEMFNHKSAAKVSGLFSWLIRAQSKSIVIPVVAAGTVAVIKTRPTNTLLTFCTFLFHTYTRYWLEGSRGQGCSFCRRFCTMMKY